MATDPEFVLQLGLAPGERVAVIGAGGTTRLASRLAQEWAGAGGRPWISTTTRLDSRELDAEVNVLRLPPDESGWDAAVSAHPLRGHAGESLALGVEDPQGGRLAHRLGAVPEARCEGLAAMWPADLLIWKADGTRGQPFKAHAPHEPEIPTRSSRVVAVVGVWVHGRPIVEDEVHRAELVCELWGYAPGETVDEELLFRALTEAEGYRRRVPAGSEYAVFLNHRGEAPLVEVAARLAARIRAAEVPALVGNLSRPA